MGHDLRVMAEGGGFSVDGFRAWWRPRAAGLTIIGWIVGRIVWGVCFEREKGIRWMPWHQEAMKDVARCEKPWGAASRL